MFEAVSTIVADSAPLETDLSRANITSSPAYNSSSINFTEASLGKLFETMRRGGTEGNIATVEVLKQYQARLTNYAASILMDREQGYSEDVVQEALEKIRTGETVDVTRSDPELRSYLFKTVRMCAVRYNRRAKIMAVNLSSFARPSGRGVIDAAAGVVERSDEKDPVVALQREERAEQVRTAINNLPDQYIEICRAVMLMQLKYREAADLLGIPLGTVKSAIHKATSLITAALSPYNKAA